MKTEVNTLSGRGPYSFNRLGSDFTMGELRETIIFPRRVPICAPLEMRVLYLTNKCAFSNNLKLFN